MTLRALLIVGLLVSMAGWIFQRVYYRELPAFQATEQRLPRGAFHVHSNASHDSDIPLETIGAAAKSLGLDFVVVTDHNTQLAGPIEVQGVTLLSSAELSTAFGHVVQLGAEFPLPQTKRNSRDLHDHIAAIQGSPILSHPADPKHPWSGPIPKAGGIEIVNLASAAKRQAGPAYIGQIPALFVLRLRPELALAQSYDRDDAALNLWDRHPDPALVGICASDTHGWVDVQQNMKTWEIVLHQKLPTSLEERVSSILQQLRNGSFHCKAGMVGRRPRFEFYAQTDDGIWGAGSSVLAAQVERLHIKGPRFLSGKSNIVLLRNGEEILRTSLHNLDYAAPIVGTYRVEIRAQIPNVLFGDRNVPVLYSNRIRILPEPPPESPSPP